MELSTLERHRSPLFKIAILVAVGTLIACGVLYQSKKSSSQNAEAELEKIQRKLVNSLVLPADYKTVADFSLTNSSGKAVTADLFTGRWSLIFFGYMNCPDICPISLATIKNAVDELALGSVEQPQVVFVSVDPARDTPQRLEAYIGHFDKSFVGITGSVEPLSEWVSSLGIMFDRHDESTKTSYSVDHSSSILLIGPQRRIRGVLNAPLEEDTIVRDYESIVSTLSDATI